MSKFIKIAWRNMWRNWRRSMIAFVAIALGLIFLIFMDGVLGGSKTAIYGNLIKLLGGNIQVHAQGYMEKAKRMPLLPIANAETVIQTAQRQPGVSGVSSRINTGGFASSRDSTLPVTINGIQPEQEAALSLVAGHISQGRYLTAEDRDVVLIGKTLADRLQVSVNDRISLVGRATHEQMRTRSMTVIGIYNVGSPEAEKRQVYISLGEAQALYGLENQVTEITIALKSVGDEDSVADALRAALPGYEVATWQELNPALLSAYDLGEQFMTIFGVVIILIAAIGILNLMLMAVFERTREIGLLGAMGLKRGQIMGLFLLEGTLIGVMGAIAGCILGVIALLVSMSVGFDMTAYSEAGDMMALMGTKLYPNLESSYLVNRSAMVIVMAALASLYPAWQAAHREPAEALHYV